MNHQVNRQKISKLIDKYFYTFISKDSFLNSLLIIYNTIHDPKCYPSYSNGQAINGTVHISKLNGTFSQTHINLHTNQRGNSHPKSYLTIYSFNYTLQTGIFTISTNSLVTFYSPFQKNEYDSFFLTLSLLNFSTLERSSSTNGSKDQHQRSRCL